MTARNSFLKGFRFVAQEAVGHLPIRSLRTLLVTRALGLTLGRGALMYRWHEIRKPRAISIGAGSIVGLWATLDGRRGITIGSNVNMSSEVSIWTLQHDHRDRDFAAVGGPVHIGDRAWLSYRCTILPGVTIGEGAVVAAHALVTKDVAPYTIVGGVPAKVIGQRSRDLAYQFADSVKGSPWFI